MAWFRKKGAQGQAVPQGQQGGGMGRKPIPRAQSTAKETSKQTWVIEMEHLMLRVISLLFSFVSAYAIAQVFLPSGEDLMRKVVGYMLALGFGVLGYFLSRSIAYRLFQREGVWAYIPICLVVELVEVFCNYVMGVSEIRQEQWLQAIPFVQRPVITALAYIVLSIIPAVTLFLAVADMDLERRKLQPKEQPKAPSPSTYTVGPTQYGMAPTYGQGYQGAQSTRTGAAPQGQPGAAPNSPTVPLMRPGVTSGAPVRGQAGQVSGGQGVAVPLQGVTS